MNLKTLLTCLPLLLSACGMNYEKTASGTITNHSSYVLTVKVSEGCYDGKDHKFEVNPADSHDYKYEYMCNGHDDSSDSISVSYTNYEASTYNYFEMDLLPYTAEILTNGSMISYYEDDQPQAYVLKDSDINSRDGVGQRFHNKGDITLINQFLRIKPSSAEIKQVFIGIKKEHFSPVIPPVEGSFEFDSTIYQPMSLRTLKTTGSFYTNSHSMTCDNYECEGK